MLELQEKASLSGGVSFARMPEAEIADLVQTFGQDMLKEATHELVAGDSTGAPA